MAKKKISPEEETNTMTVTEESAAQDTPLSKDELSPSAEQASENASATAPSVPDALPEVIELPCEAEADIDIVASAKSRDMSEIPDISGKYDADALEESPMPPHVPTKEENDWGFREKLKENRTEPELVEAPATAKSDRQKFFDLKFNELDRSLTPEERQEWNTIYASYRGRSAITATIIGVDPLSIYVWNPQTEQREKKTMYCAIVVPYRVRIVIPASEMWETGEERPDYVLQNMIGASIDLIIIKVEREAGFAIGSRRLANRSQRYFFAHREDLHRVGTRISY